MVDFAAIQAAHARIQPHIHLTPVLTSERLNATSGARLFFKAENFQKVGAFKARGATNAVLALSAEVAARGVATHSSGNHAAALARAARLRGIPAHIVMPSNSSAVKVRAVEGYGGRIVFCAPNQAAREAACAQVIAETGASLVHPYEDERVIAGQGTATVELLAQVPDLDVVLCPVGGGGLLAGTALASRHLRPGLRVVAVEPAQAGDAAESFRRGERTPWAQNNTIADGLRTNIGTTNFAIMQRAVDDIVTVTEAAIIEAMRTIWQTLKIVIEPSAAVPYAALLESTSAFAGRRVGLILTGGNVDLDALPWSAPKSPA
ncbi:pyridoxal-phosphate dependent enzyme [Opitutus sp. ER46]|uniref:pyridoxal-phosphate dependent enzyme n=1 Tax=Opitutus sp. ER46 TaxID=2161864 RepID=UPI000D2FD142|nr:pyridoxal-phosphate dependent enzyme [Opitutus sp. ER46]PTX95663.1 serine dehydratase [Opitutus sp. ER46]